MSYCVAGGAGVGGGLCMYEAPCDSLVPATTGENPFFSLLQGI